MLTVAARPRRALRDDDASRARGPSAPLAERAQNRCRRSLALPVGTRAPLANAPTFARAGAPEGATRMPRARVRSASGLGMRGRLDPKRLALRYRTRVAAGGCQSHDRRSGTGGKTDRFPDYAARLRRELVQPRPGSTGLGSLRRRDRIVDPSIESVQPTCQRSAPRFRVGCRFDDSNRRVSRITSLHPL